MSALTPENSPSCGIKLSLHEKKYGMHIIETINRHYVPRRSVLGGENIFTEISRLLERMVQVASTMEILARSVDKEEKFWIELIYSAHLLERISQVANTGERWTHVVPAVPSLQLAQ